MTAVVGLTGFRTATRHLLPRRKAAAVAAVKGFDYVMIMGLVESYENGFHLFLYLAVAVWVQASTAVLRSLRRLRLIPT